MANNQVNPYFNQLRGLYEQNMGMYPDNTRFAGIEAYKAMQAPNANYFSNNYNLLSDQNSSFYGDHKNLAAIQTYSDLLQPNASYMSNTNGNQSQSWDNANNYFNNQSFGEPLPNTVKAPLPLPSVNAPKPTPVPVKNTSKVQAPITVAKPANNYPVYPVNPSAGNNGRFNDPNYYKAGYDSGVTTGYMQGGAWMPDTQSNAYAAQVADQTAQMNLPSSTGNTVAPNASMGDSWSWDGGSNYFDNQSFGGNNSSTDPAWYESLGADGWSNVINAGTGLGNLYFASEALGQQKKSNKFNRNLGKANLANQAKVTNMNVATQAENRANTRYGLDPKDQDRIDYIDDYETLHKVTGKI